MKVSIILPVYNVEKYLEECMESAINQTLDSIEIIAVNDGSTDNSIDILKKYEEKYDFVKIVTQENKGLSGARNTGLREAKGEYVYFLDSDDYIELNSMEYCYNIAVENNLDIITFDAISFADKDYTGKMLIENYKRDNKLESKVMNGQDFYNYAKEKRGYNTPIWLNFYRREFLLSNKIEFYEGIIHEDELHTLKSYILANKIMYIPKAFFNRRVRANSIMTTKYGYKNAFGMYITATEAYKFYMDKINILNENTRVNLFNNIRFFYSAALMYCDKMEEKDTNKKDFKLKIIDSLNKCDNIYNKKINLQINNPKFYYFIEDNKLILKDKIRKLIK